MRKICESKGADQLCSNCAADQHLYFSYIDSTMDPLTLYSLIRHFKPLTIFCGCTVWFVTDLVGNPEDRFSHDAAHQLLSLHHLIGNSFVLHITSSYSGSGNPLIKDLQ